MLHRAKQTLDLADARKRVLGAVPVISLDSCFERLLQADLPLMQLEGVAPANFHLGPGGIGLCETIASMRNGALNKVNDLVEARHAQLGAKRGAVKIIIQGVARQMASRRRGKGGSA